MTELHLNCDCEVSKINTFIQQECFTLIKSDKDIYNVTKDLYFK